ncbi:MAG: hypothetical protein HY527_19235 [Betaproteobacteria bacterium]|nr:hypothetical protein [Betaproteobacteria bacterium]
MNEGSRPYLLVFESRQRNWLERIAYALGAVAVIVIGFFFLTVALVVGALLALVVIARLWWVSRKLQRERDRDVFEGEYKVVNRSESERRR